MTSLAFVTWSQQVAAEEAANLSWGLGVLEGEFCSWELQAWGSSEPGQGLGKCRGWRWGTDKTVGLDPFSLALRGGWQGGHKR